MGRRRAAARSPTTGAVQAQVKSAGARRGGARERGRGSDQRGPSPTRRWARQLQGEPARLGPAPCLWPCISSLQPALHPASRLSPPRTLLPLASHRAHCAAADCVSRRCGGSGAGKRRRERAAAIRRWARPPHTGKVCRPVSRYGAASATRPAVRACSICVGDQNARPTFHWAECPGMISFPSQHLADW